MAGTKELFFSCVWLFYEKTFANILEKFPKDQTLADVKVLDTFCRMEVTAASIVCLCNHFTKCTPEELDDILSELNDYQRTGYHLLTRWCTGKRILMSCIPKPGDSSQKRFSNLFQLFLCCYLTQMRILNVFSMVQKIRTDCQPLKISLA